MVVFLIDSLVTFISWFSVISIPVSNSAGFNERGKVHESANDHKSIGFSVMCNYDKRITFIGHNSGPTFQLSAVMRTNDRMRQNLPQYQLLLVVSSASNHTGLIVVLNRI